MNPFLAPTASSPLMFLSSLSNANDVALAANLSKTSEHQSKKIISQLNNKVY